MADYFEVNEAKLFSFNKLPKSRDSNLKQFIEQGKESIQESTKELLKAELQNTEYANPLTWNYISSTLNMSITNDVNSPQSQSKLKPNLKLKKPIRKINKIITHMKTHVSKPNSCKNFFKIQTQKHEDFIITSRNNHHSKTYRYYNVNQSAMTHFPQITSSASNDKISSSNMKLTSNSPLSNEKVKQVKQIKHRKRNSVFSNENNKQYIQNANPNKKFLTLSRTPLTLSIMKSLLEKDSNVKIRKSNDLPLHSNSEKNIRIKKINTDNLQKILSDTLINSKSIQKNLSPISLSIRANYCKRKKHNVKSNEEELIKLLNEECKVKESDNANKPKDKTKYAIKTKGDGEYNFIDEEHAKMITFFDNYTKYNDIDFYKRGNIIINLYPKLENKTNEETYKQKSKAFDKIKRNHYTIKKLAQNITRMKTNIINSAKNIFKGY